MTFDITFPEGLTFATWLEILAADSRVTQTGLSADDLAAAVGHEGSIEGWLFPETYRFETGTTDLELLTRAYRKMQAVLAEAWAARTVDGILESPRDALILASIVEKETGRPEDRELIARVFLNRLEIDMRLQSDPTVIYGLGESFDGDLRRRDLRNPHVYNTYAHRGLPPGPICMPGRAAIRAVLHAAEAPYFYFVARGDGSSQFSVTLDEHNAAVNRYQRGGN